MLKKELRFKYVKKRSFVSPNELEDNSLAIANKLLELPSIWSFNYYHIFLPIIEKKEIDTSYILSILQGKDKNVLLPKINGNNTLINYLLTDNITIKKNKWNIPEPIDGIEISADKIEVIFIPLLVFDKKGNRVGYGKGFYDSLLKQCDSKTIKIGLSLFEAEEVITDIYDGDIPLNYCVTPKNIYSF